MKKIIEKLRKQIAKNVKAQGGHEPKGVYFLYTSEARQIVDALEGKLAITEVTIFKEANEPVPIFGTIRDEGCKHESAILASHVMVCKDCRKVLDAEPTEPDTGDNGVVLLVDASKMLEEGKIRVVSRNCEGLRVTQFFPISHDIELLRQQFKTDTQWISVEDMTPSEIAKKQLKDKKYYQIDFGNHLRCCILTTENGIKVEHAVNGYGDPVPLSEIVFYQIN